MLENILKINGVQKLEGSTQKNIKGGTRFNTNGICPQEGDYCNLDIGADEVRCLAGPFNLQCVNNVWVALPNTCNTCA
ncbi:hypothetical protein EV195_10563 [Tenacibaculum skagerrakense]|uniref:Uncharacterized protein n=1 Tax=Tenacibaculum skagerrakense TaxID=186571 RepID=A0A4R2NS93_9FLAO|nr:hypothetical protein [Tenacibaculum skagerrakense]TCP24632.1 hypothetical protein EV195_10563 [Tenacibaculum skagerrakense]